MFYYLSYNLLLLLHLIFIFYVIFGSLLNFFSYKFIFIHIPSLLWGILVEINNWICPLTPIELSFRFKYEKLGISDEYYTILLRKIIYPDFISQDFQKNLAITLILINFIFYILIFKKKYFFKN